MQNLIQQNTDVQAAELEHKHRRNIIIRASSRNGEESEKREENETKVNVLKHDEITIERTYKIGKKEEGKTSTIIAKCLNYKQCKKVLNKCKELKLWDNLYKRRLQREYCGEKENFA